MAEPKYTDLTCPKCGAPDKVAKRRCCGGRMYKCYSCAFAAPLRVFQEGKLPSDG